MSATHTPGKFVWRELLTTDDAKAQAFYGELFGWSYKSVPVGPNMTYHLVENAGKQIAGIMKSGPSMPAPSHWASLISVPDVDAAASKVTELGGKVVMAPHSLENVGRFAVCLDFAGAAFQVFKSAHGDEKPAFPPARSTFCWETLTTSDLDRAKSFYGQVAGWSTGEMPGGAPGVTFKAKDGETVADAHSFAGVPSNWMTYVVVDHLETSRERAEKLGAKVLEPLIEVPQIGRISIITDPTGAPIGLFQGTGG